MVPIEGHDTVLFVVVVVVVSMLVCLLFVMAMKGY